MKKVIIIFTMFLTTIFVYMQYHIYDATAFINEFFFNKCADPAVLNPKDFSWTHNFRSKWQNIRSEYIAYVRNHPVPYHKMLNEYCHQGWSLTYYHAITPKV